MIHVKAATVGIHYGADSNTVVLYCVGRDWIYIYYIVGGGGGLYK